MKRGVTVLFAWVFLFSATGQAQDEPIRNFLRVNADFCTAGQPTLAQVETLKADGFRTVLNLRVPSEHDAAAEESLVRQLGMNYFNIPIAGANIPDEQVEEFLAVTDDARKPARCSFTAGRPSAWPPSGWFAVSFGTAGTFPTPEAEAREVGLDSEGLEAFVAQYLERHVPR